MKMMLLEEFHSLKGVHCPFTDQDPNQVADSCMIEQRIGYVIDSMTLSHYPVTLVC